MFSIVEHTRALRMKRKSTPNLKSL
uniref:Uncharacterized protein n=1 Tax=Arundo donax TaxID=35708 RepID=A0A0A8Z0D5_ARUDO